MYFLKVQLVIKHFNKHEGQPAFSLCKHLCAYGSQTIEHIGVVYPRLCILVEVTNPL